MFPPVFFRFEASADGRVEANGVAVVVDSIETKDVVRVLEGSSIIASGNGPALQQVVEPVLYAHGAMFVDLTLKPERQGWVFRVAIELAGSTELGGGVTLDVCAGISRDLSAALDVAEIITHPYVLEVTSPGVERPLRRLEEFARFAGQKAKLVMARPEAGSPASVEGTLAGVDGEHILVQVGTDTVRVNLAQLKYAHLVFSFGKAKKPGNPRKPKGNGTPAKTKNARTNPPRAGAVGTE